MVYWQPIQKNGFLFFFIINKLLILYAINFIIISLVELIVCKYEPPCIQCICFSNYGYLVEIKPKPNIVVFLIPFKVHFLSIILLFFFNVNICNKNPQLTKCSFFFFYILLWFLSAIIFWKFIRNFFFLFIFSSFFMTFFLLHFSKREKILR